MPKSAVMVRLLAPAARAVAQTKSKSDAWGSARDLGIGEVDFEGVASIGKCRLDTKRRSSHAEECECG